MGKYEIKIKVEFVECEKSEHIPEQQEDGSYTMVINEDDAISIDNSERALLQTVHPAIRAAISQHLSEISKKKPLKKENPEM